MLTLGGNANTMILENFVDLTIIILKVVLFFIFVSVRSQSYVEEDNYSLKQLTYLSGVILISYTCYVKGVPSLFSIIITLSMYLLFIRLFYHKTVFYSLFLSIVYYFICLVSGYITLIAPKFFLGKLLSELLLNRMIRILIHFSYIVVIAILVFLSAQFFNHKMHLSRLQKLYYILLSVTVIVITDYMLIFTMNFVSDPSLSHKILPLVMINIVFLLMFVSVMVYVYLLGKSNEENTIHLEREKQYELEKKQYSILLDMTSSLRRIKHDSQQHLSVIKMLTRNKEWDKLEQYVDSYSKELDKTNLLISTGNTAVDCIVSSKLLYADQLELPIKYSIVTPPKFPINDICLSSIIGNLLDNAIESSVRCHEKDPTFTPQILFYIKPFQNMIVIHIENKYNGIIVQNSDNDFASLKSDKNHGIGLKRVTEIIAENHGIISINTDNNIFTVHILLPQKEEIEYDS